MSWGDYHPNRFYRFGQDNRHGTGINIWPNGLCQDDFLLDTGGCPNFSAHICLTGDFYDGQWWEDEPSGRGVVIWANGTSPDTDMCHMIPVRLSTSPKSLFMLSASQETGMRASGQRASDVAKASRYAPMVYTTCFRCN